MAGAGYKLFNTGDVLTAAQVNTYLMQQTVMVFASATARTTALSGVLAEGMVSYLQDTNALEVYDGSAWVASAAGDITSVTAGTGISGGGTSGAVTITNSMATEITAAGDIILGTGSGTFDNLPIGTTGQVLTADTTVSPYKVKWATPATTSSGLVYITGATPSSSSGQSINNCFTSTYDNYIVTFTPSAASANSYFYFRLRASSTDTSANYDARRIYWTTGTPGSDANANGTDRFALCGYTSAAIESCMPIIHIFKPQKATRTNIYTQYFQIDSGGGAGQINFGTQTDTTQFDGFSIYPGSGTFSGQIRVYGIANS